MNWLIGAARTKATTGRHPQPNLRQPPFAGSGSLLAAGSVASASGDASRPGCATTVSLSGPVPRVGSPLTRPFSPPAMVLLLFVEHVLGRRIERLLMLN